MKQGAPFLESQHQVAETVTTLDLWMGYQRLGRKRGFVFKFLQQRRIGTLQLRVLTIPPPITLLAGILLSMRVEMWWLLTIAAIALLLLSAWLASTWIGREVAQVHLMTDMFLLGEDEVSLRLDAQYFVMSKFLPALNVFFYSSFLHVLLDMFDPEHGRTVGPLMVFLPPMASAMVPLIIWKGVDVRLGYGYPISLALYDTLEYFCKRLLEAVIVNRLLFYPLIALSLLSPAILVAQHNIHTQITLWTITITCWATLLIFLLAVLRPPSDEELARRAAFLNWRFQKLFKGQRDRHGIR